MYRRTHIAIGTALGFYFIPYVTDPLVFFPLVVFASLLPDADSAFSYLGKKPVFKPIQWVSNHRGIFHTYTMCILLSILLALFIPIAALPFFVGYSFHLFADSFTVNGITPFWPLKHKSKGLVRSGGPIDKALFVVFVIISVFLFVSLFF